MNKVIVCGNIATDIELRSTKSDKKVATFNIALQRIGEGADFIQVIVWNKQAENLKEYCKKGDKIVIEGRIQTSSYEKDDKKHYMTSILAERIEYLAHAKKEAQEPKETPNRAFEEFGEHIATESTIGEQIQITDDDLPF